MMLVKSNARSGAAEEEALVTLTGNLHATQVNLKWAAPV